MRYIEKVSGYEYVALPGSSIWNSVQELLSIHRTQDVSLVFNSISIKVYPTSCEEDLYEKYILQSPIRRISE